MSSPQSACVVLMFDLCGTDGLLSLILIVSCFTGLDDSAWFTLSRWRLLVKF